MKNVDLYYERRKMQSDTDQALSERIYEIFEKELARLGYTLDEVRCIEGYLHEQVQQYIMHAHTEFQPIGPYDWIEAEHKSGTVEQMITWNR